MSDWQMYGERTAPTVVETSGKTLALCRYDTGQLSIRSRNSEGGILARQYGERTAERWREIMATAPCPECGEHPDDEGWCKPIPERMRETGLCFWCLQWTDAIKERTPDDVVVGGCLYTIGETEQSIARRCHFPMEKGRLRSDYRHVLGHGGAEFTIEFFDGRRVTTTNLWCGGTVPEHFRDRLPDSGRFMTREKSHAYVGAGSASV